MWQEFAQTTTETKALKSYAMQKGIYSYKLKLF